MKKLGLGIQELEKFKKNNLIYVDKTKFIHKMITEGDYYFLSRPRRFGKSLLVNTIKSLFEGKKELFEGTWIYHNWDFEKRHPVIKISFAGMDYENLELDIALSRELDRILSQFEIENNENQTYVEKFNKLIEQLGNQENKTVILIDEYDKPIIDYLGKSDLNKAEKNREILKNFYSGVKDRDSFIEFFFVTGVSKFSKVSIFSELNNLTDITLNADFSQLAGYTQQEIIQNYSDYLEQLEKELTIDREKLLDTMQLWYNGYSWDGKNFLYNPYSILNLLNEKNFKNYWFKSGTPTFLTKIIRDRKIDISKYDKRIVISDSTFDSYEIPNIDLSVLLFQSGYLTIKNKFMDSEYLSVSYEVGYPNFEVRDSFYNFLISEFTNIDKTAFLELIKELLSELEQKKFSEFVGNLKSIFSQIPSAIFIKDNEAYYHTVIYLILKLMKANVIAAELQTNFGRIDAVVETEKYVYIMEFKMSSVDSALKQIKEKKYFQPYLNDKREVYCVGIAFDKSVRNINEYKVLNIEELISN